MLTLSCHGEFNAADRIRGELLTKLGAVRLTAVGQDGAMGIAEGSSGEDYIVGADFSGINEHELGLHCDCPQFEFHGKFCKHLWAMLNEIDRDYDVLRKPIRSLELFDVDITTLDVGGKREKKSIKKASSTHSEWKLSLRRIVSDEASNSLRPTNGIPSQVFFNSLCQYQHWFVLSLSNEVNETSLQVDTFRSVRKQDGDWGKPTPSNVSPAQKRTSVDQHERVVFSLLQGQSSDYMTCHSYYRPSQTGSFRVDADIMQEAVAALQATGRFAWKLGDSRFFEDARPLQNVDIDGLPWRLSLSIAPETNKTTLLVVTANLLRCDEVIPISRIMLASDAGYAIIQHPVVEDESAIEADLIRIDLDEASAIRAWQQTGSLHVPRRSLNTLLAELDATHSAYTIELDASLEIAQATIQPSGRCLLKQRERNPELFDASLFARYGDADIAFDSSRRWWWDADEKRMLVRDTLAENDLLKSVPVDSFRVESGTESNYRYFDQQPLPSLFVPRARFIDVVEKLRQADWEVMAEGSPIRIATDFNISVSSGTDWFDLYAEADFDGVTATLPQLLAALLSGKQTFVLDDGSVGMLPEAWLKKFAGLRSSGEMTEDGIRFGRTQALLLDAMLAEQDQVSRDRSFTEFCTKLKAFEGIGPAEPPETFVGSLRPYQQLGLGWFEFLREFRFGGCLADDMGLGKTIQVLALLENRRTRELQSGEKRKPSLAVVPKSLVFNWIDEAKNFTPELQLLNYTGTDRGERLAAITSESKPLDLILTTYGTLRRDASELRETEFDYVILDEAQAIKNPQSQAAKASRLLRGEHRLAMTGTPVENHLGDLWSLFDFLNPGMLGKTPRVAQLPNAEDRERITHVSQSLRPFILRRTKAQVLTELPDKVEQTLTCEMEPKQRKLYNQLKEHYRLHLSKKVKELGIKRSKIHVLEALLRLRQAACDPRLVNPDCKVKGAKILNLVVQLEEIIGEGHKALVFSQFTTLLRLVRKELDDRKWTYEYLDGTTNNRASHVKRFQEDNDCQLFLISLKAGGNGLNLTAADYVFILDPWWNPAVEAQAIDRAHRMGQTKSVMAYRMICQDTVEEKIIELQQSKRDLADAIISQDKSLISELTADDLQALLA